MEPEVFNQTQEKEKTDLKTKTWFWKLVVGLAARQCFIFKRLWRYC